MRILTGLQPSGKLHLGNYFASIKQMVDAQNAGEQHQMALVILGLVVSIPIIVWGSQIVLKLMDRFPVIILLGGMLLGWIAGGMFQTDPMLKDLIPQEQSWHYALGAAGALLVLAIGQALKARRARGKKAACHAQ